MPGFFLHFVFSLGVIMTNTEIKFHILLFTLSSSSDSQSLSFNLQQPGNLTNQKSPFPTKVCVSLSLPQWKVLCSATQVVDDMISRVKDGEPVDWRYDLRKDVYVIIKAPQLTIHIRKYFVPNGEWTLHPTNIGVTLCLYEWKELKKIIPLFEDRDPELMTMDNKVTGED
jgi:hypothetical protein